MSKDDVIIYLKASGFSLEQINSIVNALEGEAFRAGVKYVVDKLRGRLYYVPRDWMRTKNLDNKMVFDIVERALDECAENAQIGGD